MHQSTADLIKALDKEEAKRQAAIAALVSMGRPVVPQLLDILELQVLAMERPVGDRRGGGVRRLRS